MAKFNLMDYKSAITDMAAAEGINNREAIERFIKNLTVMRPYYRDGNNSLNYHALGQEWNKLPYTEKIRQKEEVIGRLTSNNRRGGRNE